MIYRSDEVKSLHSAARQLTECGMTAKSAARGLRAMGAVVQRDPVLQVIGLLFAPPPTRMQRATARVRRAWRKVNPRR